MQPLSCARFREVLNMKLTPWLIRQSGGPRRVRLYCFSYSGGSAASYLPWQEDLEPDIEICAVQLPGRGARAGEKPYSSLPTLIETLAQIIAKHSASEDKLPFAFFGHSLGAIVAFEVARYCKRHYFPMPRRIFVSGCDAPQHRSPCKNLHKLSDSDLIDALKDYNGTPPEILEHRELMDLVLPAIRADFSLGETYRYLPSHPLNIPITVLAGKLDEHILLEELQEWRKETTNECRVQWFEGDHFYINAEKQGVLEVLKAELADIQYVQSISSGAGQL